jgi:hypothetical protein
MNPPTDSLAKFICIAAGLIICFAISSFFSAYNQTCKEEAELNLLALKAQVRECQHSAELNSLRHSARIPNITDEKIEALKTSITTDFQEKYIYSSAATEKHYTFLSQFTNHGFLIILFAFLGMMPFGLGMISWWREDSLRIKTVKIAMNKLQMETKLIRNRRIRSKRKTPTR